LVLLRVPFKKIEKNWQKVHKNGTGKLFEKKRSKLPNFSLVYFSLLGTLTLNQDELGLE
jgi:hypothetical protein